MVRLNFQIVSVIYKCLTDGCIELIYSTSTVINSSEHHKLAGTIEHSKETYTALIFSILSSLDKQDTQHDF